MHFLQFVNINFLINTLACVLFFRRRAFNKNSAKNEITSLWVDLHCKVIMTSLAEQKPAIQWPPPCPFSEVSSILQEKYQAHGVHSGNSWCFAQRYEGAHVMNWSASFVDGYCDNISVSGSGSYSRNVVESLSNALQLKLDRDKDFSQTF